MFEKLDSKTRKRNEKEKMSEVLMKIISS